MQKAGLISVVVPVYNAELYLVRCIESILNQTYSNLELILINDGSIDNSNSICMNYEKKDARVRYVSMENQGQGHARNVGINLSKGEFVGFVDSDDEIELDMYEILFHYLTNYNADLAGCGHSSIFSNKTEIHITNEVNYCNKIEALKLFADCEIFKWSVCDKLFRKSKIADLRFSEEKLQAEDTRFLINFIDKNESFVFVEKAKYHYYRNNGDSCTKQKYNKSNLGLLYFYGELANILKKFELYSLSERQYARYYECLLSSITRIRKYKIAEYNYLCRLLRKEIKKDITSINNNTFLKFRYKMSLSLICVNERTAYIVNRFFI